MRDLWMYHAWYTREVVGAMALGSADLQEDVSADLANAEAIGNAVGSYFGQTAGSQFADLLKQHITIGQEVVDAAKTGDQNKLSDANTRWHQNAEAMAKAAAGINSQWSEQTLLDDLNMHLNKLTAMANAMLQGDWAQANTINKDYIEGVMTMADHLSEGIIAKMPVQFR